MKADTPEYKNGTVVYHLGDGSRGVVIGVSYDGGAISYRVATGFGVWAMAADKELTAEYEDVKALIED